ncbi:MAG: aminotransferase class I/II-fold pyridoxal phosphate-dependent enzyme, partial [Bdellovibrionales bacterium]|nr:aminotransferase class I/II-fold pyridoxal phosphate-dependent enzyme [Bdellovibrionales bacterium]
MSDITVPLLDLKAQYEPLKAEIESVIREVCDSQWFIGGAHVDGIEKGIAQYCGAKHAVGVSSGTDAELIGLMALGIEPGDEIITTPYTFFATVGGIVRAGAKPVFVDIDPVTFNIDPAQIEAKINKRTKMIIPVHLYGQCADMDPILAIAKQHDLNVGEDSAQAIGARYKGKMAGN